MWTSAQLQSTSPSPTACASASAGWAKALACRKNRSAPRAIRYPIGKLPSSSHTLISDSSRSAARSGAIAISSGIWVL